MEKTNEQIAMRISWNTIIGNAVLTVFKLFAGLFAHSSAMISDAVHSFSDVLSTIVVMVGVKLANQKSDKEHPYGHERFECVAAIILAVMLLITGLLIGWNGIQNVISGNYDGLTIPGTLALVAAIVSIVTKEAMYWYTRAGAKKINSGALMADAWHHRSDALSSIGSFAGILGARLGFPVLDSVASVVICVFILKVAVDVFIDSIKKMTDQSCEDAVVEEIRAVILAQESVLGIDKIKTRLFGDRIYVDVEISGDGNSTLYEAHNVAQRVHDAIEKQFPKVKHCMVHMNPTSKVSNDNKSPEND